MNGLTDADEDQRDDEEHEEDAGTGQWRWVPTWVCTDPTGNGHHQRWPSTGKGSSAARTPLSELSDDARDRARAGRREVIDCNKSCSAERVRLDWLRNYLNRKSAPTGTGSFLAIAQAIDADTLAGIGGYHLAADLLAVEARRLWPQPGPADPDRQRR